MEPVMPNVQVDISRRRPKDDVVAGVQTKSDKIRELAKAGYSRSEIANYLGVRYQFVRNVLVNDEQAARHAKRDQSVDTHADRDAATAAHGDKLYPTKVKIDPQGRVEIPSAFLLALGLKENDSVILSLKDDVLQLMSLPVSVRRAQAMIRQFVPEGVSLVDELLAERRTESQREDNDG
jgi:bifunctional DNA-binding transcriptional regulator/antitoxin component of YhaV-PrlF toxin-antitoxin module